MNAMPATAQTPVPGTRTVRFRGDVQRFILTLAHPVAGSAWVRTNIGQAAVARQEIIREVDRGEAPLGRDWFDIPMKRVDATRFQADLPLCEPGHFEGKCLFLPDGETEPAWPEGPNVEINVAPADACCGNIIYNAFVRQFGPNKGGRFDDQEREKEIEHLDRAGYTVIPPSGTFRDLIRELDFIVGTLGCRIIQLLPIHPTPTTYGRMGRFGSPYASLSFTEVDPALAEFDPRTTPLDQFIELVDAVHARNARLLIDIAINHTGWAASLHETHPRWLARKENGEIEMPGAWGVTWADLTRLDYDQKDLWRYMAGIFLKWCRRGVDGFRCDAGYMIPIAAWRYIIASVREQFPETLFVLEGLGGKISVTRDLLNRGNFDWAYSELFQNYDRAQIEHYLPEAIEIASREGGTVHFAETHDNQRLASTSAAYARMRTALCALLSPQGAFGFANGVEWLATEKIDVHQAGSLNWGAEPNQVARVRRLSLLLRHHPAFGEEVAMRLIQAGEGSHIVMCRHHRPTGNRLLILANLDWERETLCSWQEENFEDCPDEWTDLLTGRPVSVGRDEKRPFVRLDSGAVLCLSPDPADLERIPADPETNFRIPPGIQRRRLRAKVLELFRVYHGNVHLDGLDPEEAANALFADPIGFCRTMNPHGRESRAIEWQWPRDLSREVMVPPDHFLLVRSPAAFRARVESRNRVLQQEDSLTCADGSFFALFPPQPSKPVHRSCRLMISVYETAGCRHETGALLVLAPWRAAAVPAVFTRKTISGRTLLFLGTNGRGGMARAHVRWGELTSRYDALLAGNPDREIPENRRVMFTRCRVWMVFQGYSQKIDTRCLTAFRKDPASGGIWHFQVPVGQGEQVRLNVGMETVTGENALAMVFSRLPAASGERGLADTRPVKLIIRPDIEDRDFHDTTKAYTGPEQRYAESVRSEPDGFMFSPDPPRRLVVRVRPGNFVPEPEWQYMVHRSTDAERGLDPDSDLFSPGYFAFSLRGGEAAELTARIVQAEENDPPAEDGRPMEMKNGSANLPKALEPLEVLKAALNDFVVRRDALKSVIAGYPWFLDWGRDSLIVVRGLIEAGRLSDAQEILEQFGRFEQGGTLPNMIRGHDAGNRDTSDAPLWFSAACQDLSRAQGDGRLFDTPCGDRTFRDVLVSIGRAYAGGTANGIRMDPESGLIFSPSHFTWMDTNHPAGTPRQGYPIEIQALWHAALRLLAVIDQSPDPMDWHALARRVGQSVRKLFWLDGPGHLSDCLHADPNTPAKAAAADDALRPNQLFAITLETVTDTAMCERILTACQELLVPGAIRSLADRPVQMPIEIRHNGSLLNDPVNPYRGTYAGDEDTRRKPAYHNGTAWTWPFPAFCEAWAATYGRQGRTTALDWLASAGRLLEEGCIGHVPEILDGDHPHRQRGCDAQAWGAGELLRVWLKLSRAG